MAFQRGFDGSDPVSGERVGRLHEERRVSTRVVAAGTLACPRCDAPVSPGGRAWSPSEPFMCPYCFHDAAVRDFVSLSAPSRPARVEIVIRG
jgi:hypothetical protein